MDEIHALGIDNVLEVDAVVATCRVDELDNIDTLLASGGVELEEWFGVFPLFQPRQNLLR